MRVMRAQQKQQDRHREQEFLRRRILVPVVDLLPHVEVVERAGVEVERNALHVVEHEIRAGHVRDVGECPGGFLRDAGDGVVEDLKDDDEYEVD